MAYLSEMDVDSGFVDPEGAAKRGVELCERYNSAEPFPHIVIDDFLPEEVLERCLREFPLDLSEGGVRFDREQERFKTHFTPDVLSPWYRSLFYGFNSRPFIRVLENITGIKGLIPDPFFLGAGLHEIAQGGHLSVHADFNHHKPMNLERRINLLIYLNKDWMLEYGGGLELWDLSMKHKVVDVAPIFNRCVIFNTTSNSFHGNPEVINHPNGVSRKSIALYYYTSTWDSSKRDHTTQFKMRSGSDDSFDFRVKCRELMQDILPPILYRKWNAKKIDRD
ncbi:MAG TPA: 2OG-Fe(II) oxygenase [Phenylobacterium sp.]|uniref:2OG-Fe(II) oxygenase n=1 Tax=Phenylobacterium sp. TaxID=1871053 RepID=UPI002F9253E6